MRAPPACRRALDPASRATSEEDPMIRATLLSLFSLVLGGPPLAVAMTPRGFVENCGQLSERVSFYLNGRSGSLYFLDDGLLIDLQENPSTGPNVVRDAPGLDPIGLTTRLPEPDRGRRGHVIRLGFRGASASHRIDARHPTGTTLNFFRGNDPSRWRSGVASYEEVVYRELWPGVDLVFRSAGGRVSVQVDARSSAAAEQVAFTYDGALEVREGKDGMLIETTVGTYLAPLPGSAESVALLRPASPAEEDDGAATLIDDPDRLIWSTFLGGSLNDAIHSIRSDGSGNVFVCGSTSSLDLPATPGAYDETHNGDLDTFVAKLSGSGSTLIWATYLGSNGTELDSDLTVDSAGNPIVTGYTDSPAFPVTPGAYDTEHNGIDDVFVAKLSSTGSTLLWSTFLGGSSYDGFPAVALDTLDNVFVTGGTLSSDFPVTTGAYDTTPNGAGDTYVCKLDIDGSDLVWSTFVGGSGPENQAGHIVVDENGRSAIATSTGSSDFPTTPGAFQISYGGGASDGCVFTLSGSGSELVWSSFIGGTDIDWSEDLTRDPSGNVTLLSGTLSADFPVTPGAYDTTHNGESDFCIAKLLSDGSRLLWCTFVGGGASEGPGRERIVVDEAGRSTVAASTHSPDFPTTPGAFQKTYGGGGTDGCIFLISASGSELLWSSFIGGANDDLAEDCDALPGGIVLIGGYTSSALFPTTPGAYDTNHNGAVDGFILSLDTTPVAVEGDYWVHRATGDNITNNYTRLDHPLLDDEPTAVLLVTQNWNPGGGVGVYNDHNEGVWYTGSHWAVFNEDQAPMPEGAAFNLLLPGQTTTNYVHRAIEDNTEFNYTVIEHPSTTDPNAIVFATQNYNPGGGAGVYNDHAIGVFYTGSHWAVFNQDQVSMPLGAAFNILVQEYDENVYVHTATAENSAGNSTYLDHPWTNGNPDAVVTVTQNWNPGGGPGVYNDHAIGVWYTGSQWAVFNQDGMSMPLGASFNVLVDFPPLPADVEEPGAVATPLHLRQNAPNPFGGTTNIRFALPEAAWTKLEVFDVTGRVVRSLIDGELRAGVHEIVFNGNGLASGKYFYRLQARPASGREIVETRGLLLTR
ncbi:MAG: hypothetical protein GF346_09920 [Candidatus Eisenbacteria bacterium]|nr:hypothetical protein [Candidatus Latescibacterota bacterium]MBD3302751.1 hypothetical protein [Candidatus Eisenbacteria bacterium]